MLTSSLLAFLGIAFLLCLLFFEVRDRDWGATAILMALSLIFFTWAIAKTEDILNDPDLDPIGKVPWSSYQLMHRELDGAIPPYPDPCDPVTIAFGALPDMCKERKLEYNNDKNKPNDPGPGNNLPSPR